jgi:ectoine hydroxylase-related dioxygenase (phytanoyl-CoA dioxygenase family)
LNAVTNETARKFYEENGFIVFDNPIVDRNLVRRACEGMDKVRAGEYDTGKPPEKSSWNPGDDPARLCKMEAPQQANYAIRELIASSGIGEHVAAVTGAEMVQVWWVQLLYKPSSDGSAPTQIGWHQDWNYWTGTWEEGSELLTAWFALSDVGEDSGPMRFVPGSHKWGFMEGSDFYGQDTSRENLKVPPGQSWTEVPAVMGAGCMSLHHKLTLHASSHNTSGEPRRSFALHLRTEKSRPLNGGRARLARLLDDPQLSPIIYGDRIETAF